MSARKRDLEREAETDAEALVDKYASDRTLSRAQFQEAMSVIEVIARAAREASEEDDRRDGAAE